MLEKSSQSLAQFYFCELAHILSSVDTTLDRVQNAISEILRGVISSPSTFGSDKAGGYQTLDRPLRTLTTLDRFGLVRRDCRSTLLQMPQVPELKRAMGLPSSFRLNYGTRRDRIKLMGNGICPPVMKAVEQTVVASSRNSSRSAQRETLEEDQSTNA